MKAPPAADSHPVREGGKIKEETILSLLGEDRAAVGEDRREPITNPDRVNRPAMLPAYTGRKTNRFDLLRPPSPI